MTSTIRPIRSGPGAPLGIDENLIRDVVHGFYGRIRSDAVLMDIFGPALGQDWTGHLAKMCDFWSSVLLMSGRFKGTPMAVHAALPGLEAAHFRRWLGLFRETVGDLCPGERAALFVAKAEMIGRSLQLGLAAGHVDAWAGHPPDLIASGLSDRRTGAAR